MTAAFGSSLDPRRPAPGVAVFALTVGGAATAACIASMLQGDLWLPESQAEAARSRSLEGGSGIGEVRAFAKVGPALREAFTEGRPLVCVMASGIVVRSLAPILRDKTRDPGVLVVDEEARFVVPLLSGHLGGANALAGYLARALGAQAVLTTSSDVQGLLGPDLLAAQLDAQILNPPALLSVSSALVNGEGVDLWYSPSELGRAAAYVEGLNGYRARVLVGKGPQGQGATGPEERGCRDEAACIVLSIRSTEKPRVGLGMVPRLVVAGVGCKRGTSSERLVGAVREALDEAGLHPACLRALASIRLKADEGGILDAAEALDVPAVFASTEAIEGEIQAHGLREESFVRQAVGAGAVSEPAALWAAGEGSQLLLPKRAGLGVTVALALADGAVVMEKTRGRWSR